MFAVAMNHRYEGGGFMFCPHAVNNDGLLDYCLVHDMSTADFFRLFPSSYEGHHLEQTDRVKAGRSRTIEMRLQRCDTIIYLDFDRWQCLQGVIHRVIRNYGKNRPDMGGNCKERFDWDFMKYIWNFNEQNRIRNYTWIASAKHAKAIVLKNRKEVKRFLENL